MWKAIIEPELVEHGIRCAASIAHYYISKGIAVGFGCNGRLPETDEKQAVRIEPVTGEAHLAQLFDTMAALLMERSLPIETFLDNEIKRQTKNFDYMVITGYENDGIRMRLDALRKNGNSVTTVPLLKEAGSLAERRA